MGRKYKLTEEQWQALFDFYDEGHTMPECAEVFGVSPGAISRKFRLEGKKARARFVPSTKEKWEALPEHHYLIGADSEPSSKTSCKTKKEDEEGPPTIKPRRKIISLAGNGGKGRMLYEKKVS